MAHVKTISSKQLEDLYDTLFQGKRLRNCVDNAGQTVLLQMSPFSPASKAKLAVLMDETHDATKVAEAYENLRQYHSMLITSSTGDLSPASAPRKHLKEHIHTHLSLLHELQPASEDFSREALKEALKVLKLPPVLEKDELKAKLPALLQSITPALGRG